MKQYLFAIIALSLSASAFASDTASPERRKEDAVFRCDFKLPGLAKNSNLACEVHAVVDFDKREASTGSREDRDRDRTRLSIRCSNGFNLRDRRAGFSVQHDDVAIFGQEEDIRDSLAVVNIHNVARDKDMESLRRDRRDSFDASLLLSPKVGVSARLDGRCRVDFED